MQLRPVLSIVAALLMCSGATMASANQVDDDYQHLIGQLVNEQITSIDMTHIPYSMIFSKAVTPAQIRQWDGFRCHVEVTPDVNKSLLAAVQAAHIVPIDGEWDLRWLLQINIKGAAAPVMIYLNGRTFIGSGQRGYLNDAPMAITNSLSRWLERTVNESCPDMVI